MNSSFVYESFDVFYCANAMNRIREEREKAGLSQSELAELCETSLRQIQYLEKGARSSGKQVQLTYDWLERIATAINSHTGKALLKPWHLIADPEELDSLVRTEEERQLLERRRSLGDEAQQAFDAMTASTAETLKNLKRN